MPARVCICVQPRSPLNTPCHTQHRYVILYKHKFRKSNFLKKHCNHLSYLFLDVFVLFFCFPLFFVIFFKWFILKFEILSWIFFSIFFYQWYSFVTCFIWNSFECFVLFFLLTKIHLLFCFFFFFFFSSSSVIIGFLFLCTIIHYGVFLFSLLFSFSWK